MLRVVLCDDHEIVREAIGARLENAQGIEVIAEAGDGRELIEIARRLAPDVAIVDLELPGRDGIATTREVLAACPQTSVMILTAHAEGLRAAEIATRLSLKPATVHSHVRKAVDKLGAASSTEAVALVERYSYIGVRPRG